MKVKKKPIKVEAIQWTGSNSKEIANFINDAVFYKYKDSELYIYTLEGVHCASKMDWVVKGVDGEFYPCKPDIFELTYEAAE